MLSQLFCLSQLRQLSFDLSYQSFSFRYIKIIYESSVEFDVDKRPRLYRRALDTDCGSFFRSAVDFQFSCRGALARSSQHHSLADDADC